MKVKTITVDGFNSDLFDNKVNNFINKPEINVIRVHYSTAIAGSSSDKYMTSYKMTYTAFIEYEFA